MRTPRGNMDLFFFLFSKFFFFIINVKERCVGRVHRENAYMLKGMGVPL